MLYICCLQRQLHNTYDIGHQVCLDDKNPWLSTWKYLSSKMVKGNTWRAPGEAYWRWTMAPFAIVALVWADGHSESSQSTPWDGVENSDGTYWPCIIGAVLPDDKGRLPFYCPGLAEGNGRPWLVHSSRLRLVPMSWVSELDFGGVKFEFPYLPMSKL